MPFDGLGNYVVASAPNFPAVTGTVIVAQYYNAVINDLASSMNLVFTRDGQTQPTNNILWNNKNLTAVNQLGCVSAVVSGAVTAATITTTGNGIVGGSLTVTGAVVGSNLSGTNTGNQTIVLTGDVTGSGTGSFAATIAVGAVTLAKQANLAANSLVGNNTGVGATPLALTGAQVTAMLGNFTSALAGLVPLSGGGTVNFLRADGTWTVVQASSALLTAYAGAAWTAGVQVPTLTAANTIVLKTVGAAAGNLLDKTSGDATYSPLRPTILANISASYAAIEPVVTAPGAAPFFDSPPAHAIDHAVVKRRVNAVPPVRVPSVNVCATPETVA